MKYGYQTSNIESSTLKCCYISIDDIGVKYQKPSRKDKRKKDKKSVENTVIHIQAEDRQYTLTAIGMDIITLCDFAVTNKDGKTTFSFDVPSSRVTDYAKE